MLRIECFKAGKGDSFLITWGKEKIHHLLIDAGSEGTYRFIGPRVINFGKQDAILITHVDYDHIGGFFKWLADQQQPFNTEVSVYINTPNLIFPPDHTDKVAVEHGAKLDQLLYQRGITPIPFYLDKEKNSIKYIHGLKLHVLSPNEDVVQQLLKKWTATEIYHKYQLENQQQDNKVNSGNEVLETAEAILADPPKPHHWEDDLLNASSIAFIVCHNGNQLLFLGDSNPTLVSVELERLGYTSNYRLEVDLVKISHHGSRRNTTQDLLERIKCENYLISTDSTGPYYHPARETLILISTYGRPVKDQPINIYTNYTLSLNKLLTAEEQQALKLNIKEISQLDFSDK